VWEFQGCGLVLRSRLSRTFERQRNKPSLVLRQLADCSKDTVGGLGSHRGSNEHGWEDAHPRYPEAPATRRWYGLGPRRRAPRVRAIERSDSPDSDSDTIDRVHFIASTTVSDQVAASPVRMHGHPLSACMRPDRKNCHTMISLAGRIPIECRSTSHVQPTGSAVGGMECCGNRRTTRGAIRGCRWVERTRTHVQVACGAAAGAAAAFQAPIGGMLYLMELSTRWRIELTWRTFFSTSIAVLTLRYISQDCDNSHICHSIQSFLSVAGAPYQYNFTHPYSELPLLVLLAAIMGLLGSHFVWLNGNIVKLRKRWSHSRPLLLMEVSTWPCRKAVFFFLHHFFLSFTFSAAEIRPCAAAPLS
jgi:Voltage gated chloride channel